MRSALLISLLFSCVVSANLPFHDENISNVPYECTKTNDEICDTVDTPDVIRMITSYLSFDDKQRSRLINRTWYTSTEYTPNDITRILKNASMKGQIEVVKRLLADERVDPSANNNRAIKGASENGHSEVVKRLLADERVNPSANDNWAIKRASANGHSEVV